MAGRFAVRNWLVALTDPVWVGLAAVLVGWGLAQTGFWRQVELKLFDFLVVQSAPGQVTLPITIVGIDEATFGELKASWPLPRRHHAKLLDNLREAGVAVVGFDIVFSEASEPQDDTSFAAAIKRFGDVVLASDLSFRESAEMRQWFRVDPHPMFGEAGARQGYVTLQVDDDAVLRRVPTAHDGFWRQVLQMFGNSHPGVVASTEASDDMRIRYVGGPHTFPYIPYYQLLDPEKHLPPDWRNFFQDNIVLVGRNLHVIQDVGASQAEMYQTPFFFKTKEFMPRVEIHANLIANMISGDVLREAPADWGLALWAAIILPGVLLMRYWHPLRSGIVLLISLVILAAVEFGVFHQWRVWLPAAGAMNTVALIYVAQGAIAFIAEQRKRSELRNAFSMYVSPAVVDQIIANPERLRLGGERRQITILFSDLAGFTSIAEKLDPEQVAGILNRHLSEMTETILEHLGTVEKFIGDGIMAIWGAPVADDKQSENAVQAAIEMQRRVKTTNVELQEKLGTTLRMRVGLHRGDCIVGNIGGYKRFDYTAIGDAVNLASRLEGVNKVYGTGILASETVAAAIANPACFREVDTVRVKGKQVGITVYTPCDDATLRAMTAEALAAYREGKFELADELWHRVLARHPDDPVAAVFVARIAQFREQNWPAEWDGVTTLSEK